MLRIRCRCCCSSPFPEKSNTYERPIPHHVQVHSRPDLGHSTYLQRIIVVFVFHQITPTWQSRRSFVERAPRRRVQHAVNNHLLMAIELIRRTPSPPVSLCGLLLRTDSITWWPLKTPRQRSQKRTPRPDAFEGRPLSGEGLSLLAWLINLIRSVAGGSTRSPLWCRARGWLAISYKGFIRAAAAAVGSGQREPNLSPGPVIAET